MGFAAAALIAGAIALPHVMNLDRASPPIAAAIWFCALALRALLVLLLLIELLLFFPATTLFSALTHWCWHAVIPLLATHIGLNGHNIGDVAVLMPTIALGASLVSLAFGLVRAARAIGGMIARHALGGGPLGSVVVPGRSVLVAAAGLRRPRVIVSAGALTAFDDAELAAGVAHERGHIARKHRFILLGAHFCRSTGRVLPGASRAMHELVFHLERDADRWALARRHDALVLASAICKSSSPGIENGALLALSGSRARDRVTQLLVDPAVGPGASKQRRLMSLAAGALVMLTLLLTASVPAAAVAGAHQLARAHPAPHCED